jgi:tetratricopeptide (TPR) repeat protein
MLRSLLSIISFAAVLGFATASFAGMKRDLRLCTAADSRTSVSACTRVMNSGRLPRKQFYIGHHNRGWAHFASGDYDKALADFDKSIAYRRGYADSYFARAVVQHERGERDKSRQDLDRYLEHKRKDWKVHLNRALLFRSRGEYDQAFSDLQSASALSPENSKIAALRALVLSDMGEHSSARADAEQAITLKPKSAGAHYAKALIAFRENDLEGAKAAATHVVSLKNSYSPAHTLLGRIAETQGDHPAARAHFEKGLAVKTKSISGREAHKEARKLLSGLDDTRQTQAQEKVAQAQVENLKPAPATETAKPDARKGDCRRYIAALSVTIAMPCDR